MTGVIDVGGGLRGIYAVGVFDRCLEDGIEFDYHVGVSAGTANLASFLAGQKGRNYRFYTDYVMRPEYLGWKALRISGNLLNLDYIYDTLSRHDGEDPLDYAHMVRTGKPFQIAATDAKTGKVVWFGMEDMRQDCYTPITASSCVPVFCRACRFQGGKYFDGGIAEPIPYQYAFDAGCDKLVVVLSRPKDFRRGKGHDAWLARLLALRWPRCARVLAQRGELYNRQLDALTELERQGKVLIIAPEDIFGMDTLKRDREAMEKLYAKGYEDAAAIAPYLAGTKKEVMST